ncbi:MAG: uracil-DNA glycosylase [Dethiobacter sp.]|mgnify:CR=1 FL=1|jgi:DNA polymerase|nr:uracil-DNA glycosylase [Dethiobacter sp.]MBS3897398.1 uracil-DNA glycosylase [Dethiobacter sp.]MBS3983217.1 uracil-DNA glycosylase [Dethiobacter sp.]MCL4463133.1 uracil-DNA glycosylase [Bacillota bacterium]MCL5994227.1 uracil-DNA glycosylase [Bacillota bacterium]
MREKNLFDLLAGSSEDRAHKTKLAQPVGQPATMESLAAEVVGCARCSLRLGASRVVFGEGNPQAKLIFVGDAPGADEDRQGSPFVGASGQLLDKILAAAEIKRDEIYLTNVLKCRPPETRKPQPEEIAACRGHLQRQIELISPAIIVCLGSFAAQACLTPSVRANLVRGRWFALDGIRLMFTFHPAELLLDPAKKKPVWQDIQQVRDAYRLLTV